MTQLLVTDFDEECLHCGAAIRLVTVRHETTQGFKEPIVRWYSEGAVATCQGIETLYHSPI